MRCSYLGIGAGYCFDEGRTETVSLAGQLTGLSPSWEI